MAATVAILKIQFEFLLSEKPIDSKPDLKYQGDLKVRIRENDSDRKSEMVVLAAILKI